MAMRQSQPITLSSVCPRNRLAIFVVVSYRRSEARSQKMDASVSRLVDAYADNVVATDSREKSGSQQPEEVDVDALFDQLENEDDGNIRELRMAQLQKE